MRINGPERPSNNNRCGKISLGGGESIRGCRALEEEAGRISITSIGTEMRRYLQGQEDKHLSPYTSTMTVGINTEGFECGEDNKNGCPSVVKREG